MNRQDIDPKYFITNIRSHYFEFISLLINYSYEKLLLKLTQRLNRVLDVKYVGFYIPDAWDRTYRFISHQSEDIPHHFKDINHNVHLLHENLHDKIAVDGKMIFEQHFLLEDALIIKLPVNDQPNYLLLVFQDDQFQELMIQALQQETVRLLEVINLYYHHKDVVRKKEFLIELSTHLNSSTDKTEVLTKLTSSLRLLYPDFSFTLLMSHDYDVDAGLPIKLIEYSDDVTKRLSTRAFTTGEIQIEINDQQKHLYAPLTGSQGIYGVIQLIAPMQVFYSDHEVDFIHKLSQTAGRAIENATLYQNSIHLVSNLKLINDVTHKMNFNLQFSELIDLVKQELIKISEANQVGFVFYPEPEEDPGTWDILEASTPFFHSEEGKEFVKHLSAQIEEKQEPLFIGDYTKQCENFPYKSLIAIPMVDSGNVVGIILILHEKDGFFTFESYKLMKSLIHRSTLALTNAVLREQLEKAVITDYLTKLYSRSHLDVMLNKHMQNDDRGTLILLDIDDFKSINDTYGHYIGDEVIVQIADIIMKNIEEGDIPSRWGGEEFAIYLPQKSSIEGLQLAEKLRDQVMDETEPQVTFSCGISSWDKKREDSVSEVFIRADKALYQAKEMGKNCIVTSS